jgi:hypothetical protein
MGCRRTAAPHVARIAVSLMDIYALKGWSQGVFLSIAGSRES